MTPGEFVINVVLNGKSAERDARKLKKEFTSLGKQFNSGFLKPILKFAGVAAFSKMVIDAGKLSRQMGIVSARTGIAVENLSSMRNALKAVGGDAQVIDRVVGGLSKGLARLSRGDGETAAKLAAMNISSWGANGKTRKADDLLIDIADWTQNQLSMGRSEEEVASYLEDAFGIDYKLFKQLSKGGAEYKRILESTPKLTSEQSQNLERMNLAFSRLSATMGNFVDQMTATLAPVFEWIADLLSSIGGTLNEWPLASTIGASLIGLALGIKTLGAVIAGSKAIMMLLGLGGATSVAGTAGAAATGAVATKAGVGLLGTLGLSGAALAGGGVAGYYLGNWAGPKIADAINGVNMDSPQYWDEMAQNFQKQGKYWEAKQARMTANKIRNEFDERINPPEELPIVWADEVNGSEVMKASNSAGDTFVDVAVENNWIENPDGTYTIMTDVDVESSDGTSFTNSISKALDGGYA